MVTVSLRNITPEDLDHFFEHQLDPRARHMAAFTSADPANREAFDRHWQRIISVDTVTIRTVLVDDTVAGHVLSYLNDGKTEVSYWIGREFWGHGVATQALTLFLAELPTRPIFARVASDNTASLRVLQKCGFTIYGSASGFANARGTEIPETLLCLS